MSELKTPRLLAAAKEFNIGQDTLVEFLVKKGFSRDELKPTAKLSSDQYYALQAEFQGDKVAKNKADQVEIPKVAAQAEPKKKRDEEDLSFAKKEDKKARKEEPVAEVAPAPEVKAPAVEKVAAPEIEAPKVINKIDLSAIDSSTRPKKAAK
ncbi:MAG: translation initiation factor, partial [Bacteroidota bacterium]